VNYLLTNSLHEFATLSQDDKPWLRRLWNKLSIDLHNAAMTQPLQQNPTERFKPSVTVAAIVERNGKFLLVEEHTAEGLRLNNPAGHLDPGESPQAGCVREALEETARQFTPTALVGVYLSRFQRPARQSHEAQDITYLRFAFCGEVGEAIAGRALDTGIVRTLWMGLDELHASSALHRSPLVLRCAQDYLRGQRYPLELVSTDASVLLT
jgi:8-oxo-dGTP pyrophosphatase MutT (NUDIX family)